MNIYEHFEESELNSAYNSESLNDTLHQNSIFNSNNSINEFANSLNIDNIDNSNEALKIENSTMQNLWDFLGISKLNKKQQGCVFDCSIHGSRCLERCENKNNNNKKCNYKCLKHGLYCVKNCVLPKEEPTEAVAPIETTQVAQTTSVNSCNDKVRVPLGDRYHSNSYAPFDSTLWPQYNQPGWNLENNSSNNENYIEVLVRDYVPADEDNTNVSVIF